MLPDEAPFYLPVHPVNWPHLALSFCLTTSSSYAALVFGNAMGLDMPPIPSEKEEEQNQ
jgi:hypothetical protein